MIVTEQQFEDKTSKEELIDSEFQTIYATTKKGCSGPGTTGVTVLARSLSGPDFSCTLSNSQSAGTGLVAYKGDCKIGNSNIEGDVVIDYGNYKDHIKLALPEVKDWYSLYASTRVPYSPK